jgi:hypothetical protein
LNGYLTALTRGDTEAAKSLMGGTFLKKREPLLNNPAYRQHLIEKFANASFEIVSVQLLNEEKINVLVTTELENGDRFSLLYTIARESNQSILIIAETKPQQG